MDSLFSCRNCIHNCLQSLHVGVGVGYCLQHHSVLDAPADTTCKYLRRKDLPWFVVDEGVAEHAAEYAALESLADLHTHQPRAPVRYSERHAWETAQFDPLLNSLAMHDRPERQMEVRTWVYIQAFSAGVDGRRALAQASLVRRYMAHCGTWISSYRLVLGVLQELAISPQFDGRHLVGNGDLPASAVAEEALWDVVFSRLAILQEYGWHAGLEQFIWILDRLNSGLAELDWPVLQRQLLQHQAQWTADVIAHARSRDEFFPPPLSSHDATREVAEDSTPYG